MADCFGIWGIVVTIGEHLLLSDIFEIYSGGFARIARRCFDAGGAYVMRK